MRALAESSRSIDHVKPATAARAQSHTPASAPRSVPDDRASYMNRLQRTAGNRAVLRMLAGDSEPAPANRRVAGGYMPDPPRDSVLAGNGDPATAARGNQPPATQPPATVLGGVATSIATKDQTGPVWNNNGEFKWWINWVTNGTSGWIVQRIDHTYSGTKADGTPITDASMGAVPTYYEAWPVRADGTITPANLDIWNHPAISGGLGSQLNLSTTGTAYWTSSDPAASGFTSHGVSNAGILLSSLTAPAGLGAALSTRTAHGAWSKDGSTALPGCFIS